MHIKKVKKRWTQFLYLQVTWQCLIAEKLCHLVISFKICSTFLNISPISLFFLLTCKLTFEQINKSLHTDHFNCWAVRNNKTCLLPLGQCLIGNGQTRLICVRMSKILFKIYIFKNPKHAKPEIKFLFMFLFYDKQNLYCSVLPRLRQIPAPAHRNSIVSR